MEFGKVPQEELSAINFDLPADPLTNAAVLRTGKGDTKLYLGCASSKDKLNVYAAKYNCIELNATYYSLPTNKQIMLWQLATPIGFKFAPKFPQVVTHVKRLVNVEKETKVFLAAITPLQSRLGPIFLMPHPQADTSIFETLTKYIGTIPKQYNLFLELRHPSWFVSGYNSELLSFLIANNRGTVITDGAGRRDAVHMHLSTPQCFIRFVGNDLHETDYKRIDQWVDRIKTWMDAGLEYCYFFIHQEEYQDASTLLNYLKQKIFA